MARLDHPDQTPRPLRTDDTHQIPADSYAVLSYGDYFDKYRLHPKARAPTPPTGNLATPGHRELLRRFTSTPPLERIGKESNRLTGDAPNAETDERRVNAYPNLSGSVVDARRSNPVGSGVLGQLS